METQDKKSVGITRRSFAAAASAIAVAGLQPAARAQSGKPIEVWRFGGPKAERDYVSGVDSRFKGSQVVTEFQGWETRHQKIASAAAAGSLPSILSLEHSMVAELASRNVVVDLNTAMPDSVAAWARNFEPKFLDLGRYGKGLYGFAPTVDLSPVLLCNNEIFAAAGLRPPTTWTELIATAKRLKEGSRAGIVFAGSGATLDAEIIQSIGVRNGCRWTNSDGKFALSEVGFRDTLRLVAALVPSAPTGLTDVNFRGAIQLFFQGRAAMLITKSFVPIVQADMGVRRDFPYTMVPFPAPDKVTGDNAAASFEAQAVNFVCATRSADMAATRPFLDYWAAPEQAVGWNGSVIPGRIPTHKRILASEEFAKSFPAMAKHYADGTLFKEVISLPAFPEFGALRPELTAVVQGVLVGQYTPEVATARLIAAATKVMAK
jgi:multiple sugar transport system substrate-binding protein